MWAPKLFDVLQTPWFPSMLKSGSAIRRPIFFFPSLICIVSFYLLQKQAAHGEDASPFLPWDYGTGTTSATLQGNGGRSNHRGVLLLTALLIWPHSAASPPEPHLAMVPTKSWFLWWTSGPDLNIHEQSRKLTDWRSRLLWWSPQFSRPGFVACAVLVPRIIRCHLAECKTEEDPVSG